MTRTPSADDALAAVRRYALAVASGDRILRARPDVSADDVAQDVALQFHRMAVKPENWRGWTATATRHRLVDLARQRGGAAVLDDELQARVLRAMGPSGGVIAGAQARGAPGVLSQGERDLFGEHLLGVSNAELAERYGYRSPQVVSTLLSRIAAKIRRHFPHLHLDLEPARVY